MLGKLIGALDFRPTDRDFERMRNAAQYLEDNGHYSAAELLRQFNDYAWAVERWMKSTAPGTANSIICPQCDRESHHPVDIKEQYCGFCRQYHRDM
jgi:hypothetical protein